MALDPEQVGRRRWVVFATEPEVLDGRVRQVAESALVGARGYANGDWAPWCWKCRSKTCPHAMSVTALRRPENGAGSTPPD